MYKQALIHELNTLAGLGIRGTYMPPVDKRYVDYKHDNRTFTVTNPLADLDKHNEEVRKLPLPSSIAEGDLTVSSVTNPNTMGSRLRQAASIGGLRLGTTLGIAGGYAGSNWLSKKLGLKGQKGLKRVGDIALGVGGTVGGGLLGAYLGSAGTGYALLRSRGLSNDDIKTITNASNKLSLRGDPKLNRQMYDTAVNTIAFG